ncbi:intradiol ring-cleavage dioxygenase [Ramlibacter sp. AW1]|uniref:Intradiol ring-cleavage dioxygenase n=1 Tax=Ramlibacter aurantiacus TaxID=2801330 RepID=A0A936ZFJ5_9BURK|nr:protocatechuate 3,4-dioxygenase [Ramlibacter aurantiacus]MBL0419997.1 intradiol ring-cleavage dioxygenase [Ramlibacter aurantiacus]
MNTHPRRAVVAALVAAPAVLLLHPRARAATRPLTPAQAEGPFYPIRLPEDRDFDLLQTGSRRYTAGQPAWLDGQVTDPEGRPVAGAVVEIWQCDQDGHYHHPGDSGRADPSFQGFGQVQVGRDGRYRFRTLRPAPYSGRTPHIHVKVRLDRRELLTTQLYVQGEPRNARDGLWQRLSPQARELVTVPFRPAPDGGVQAQFPIVVEA